MRYTRSTVLAFAENHETSIAVAFAMFEAVKNYSELDRLWTYPTDIESDAVIQRAFELAPDETEMFWGCLKLTREKSK